MSSEKDFEENWKTVSQHEYKIDDITDKEIWDGIENKIKKEKSTRKFYWAAAVLIPLFTFFFYRTFQKPDIEINKTYVFEAFDKGKSYKLSDGSIIELKPYSKIILSQNFGDKDREVTFTGQGNFNITKDKTKPFRINAGNFHVQVLGTQFFLDQKSIEKKVELFEGKVKVEHAGKVTYLMPKEIWINDEYNKEHHYYNKEKDQDFAFDNSDYSEAVKQLEDTYNVKISYPSQFKNKKVSGYFTGNLNEVLSVISFPFNLKPEKINEKQIILK